ncbi:MAG: twin-arginine translocase subunit TatC [candidate division KSB1 bacterium]|nr:twin-arginine translocase subunit TatC [candidate division KSB1 bacterium]MDZ7366102.1 twin-arginine translocase subunit TatC [candidate division KSB1 bacterium]MDZ7404256.1 twin-arginine translocase subunit TatC [candidate division KSB1 bacterium]
MDSDQPQTEHAAGKRDEKEMPFLDHLGELRTRLIKSLLSVVFFTAVSWFFIDRIFDFLVAPYKQAVELARTKLQDPAAMQALHLIYLNPTGGFMIFLKLAITVGILFSIPVIIYQLWQFIAPGLLMHERKVAVWVVFFTTICFLIGALFCYYVVLKFGLGFLLSFQSEVLTPMISIDEYLGFVTILVVVFGLVFEMPVVAFFLTKIGLLTPEFMRQKRRYGIVTIFVAAAVLTPSTDAFTQMLLAVPLLLLYEISIWVCRVALPKEMKDAIGEVATN